MLNLFQHLLAKEIPNQVRDDGGGRHGMTLCNGLVGQPLPKNQTSLSFNLKLKTQGDIFLYNEITIIQITELETASSDHYGRKHNKITAYVFLSDSVRHIFPTAL